MVGKLDTKNVDGIDRPPDYRVQSTVETHDERGQKGGDERREEDEYSASSGVKGWQKYHTDAANRHALKLRKRDITKLFYNQVFLQKGLVIIDADVRLINGQIIRHAHIFSTKIDHYWKLKKVDSGQEVPVDDLITEEYVEISVLHGRSVIQSQGGSPSQTAEISKKAEPWQGKGQILNWTSIAIYVAIIILAIFLLMIIL